MGKYHVFVNPDNNHHMYSYISTIILNEYISPERIILFHKSDSFKDSYDKFKQIKIIPSIFDITDLNLFDFSNVGTINFISLLPSNAKIIINLIKLLRFDASKIFIILTDDEVNRWRRVYQIFGKLIPSKRYKIDINMIKLFEILNNYIITYEPWGFILENLFKRKLNITNYTGFIPDMHFKYIKSYDCDNFDNDRRIIYDSRESAKRNILRFLVQLSISVLFTKSSNFVKKNIKITFWYINSVNQIYIILVKLLQKLILKISRLKKINLDFIFITNMPFKEYLKMLSQNDFMIVRKRGGVSGIIYFLMLKGVPIFPFNSLNHTYFKYILSNSNILHYKSIFYTLLRIFKDEIQKEEISNEYITGYFKYCKKRNEFFKMFYST